MSSEQNSMLNRIWNAYNGMIQMCSYEIPYYGIPTPMNSAQTYLYNALPPSTAVDTFSNYTEDLAINDDATAGDRVLEKNINPVSNMDSLQPPINGDTQSATSYYFSYHYHEDGRWKQEALRQAHTFNKQVLKENAMLTLIHNPCGYCLQLESGLPIQITTFHISRVIRICYDPAYQRKENGYEIQIDYKKDFDWITETDFRNDSNLISTLEKITQTSIIIPNSSSKHNIAHLIRSRMNSITENRFISYYGGWQGGKYWTTPSGFRTSAEPEREQVFSIFHTEIPSNAQASAREFRKTMGAICNPLIRTVCLLLIYAALLKTVIASHSSSMQINLVPEFVTPSATGQAFLIHLFSLGRDDFTRSDAGHKSFRRALISNRDQPLVIIESGDGANCRKNMDYLNQVIADGIINIGDNSFSTDVPFGTTPILIREQWQSMTQMNWDRIIIISVADSDFDLAGRVSEGSKPMDYTHYSSFLAWASAHLQDLSVMLDRNKERAYQRIMENPDLTVSHASVLGILGAVAEFTTEFLKDLSIDSQELIDPGWYNYCLDLMHGNTELADPVGLSERFLSSGYRTFSKSAIPVYNIACPFPFKPEGAAYIDCNSVYIDSNAFRKICQNAGISNPDAVKNDLREHHFLEGVPTNKQSYTTRITISVAGHGTCIRVYKFRQSVFECQGEPSPFRGGSQHEQNSQT